VLTASDLAQDGYIYAALENSNTGIYRWQVGVSDVWKTIKTDTTSSYKAYGIGLQGGALYVSTANGTPGGSTIYRSLGPTGAAPTWSTMTSTAVFNIEPQGLRLSSGSAKLWAINTETTDSLYTYLDTLVDAKPTLTAPVADYKDTINPITGYPTDIMFVWSRPSEEITKYDLKIALDSAFDQLLTTVQTSGGTPTVSQNLAGSTFQPGLTYYWRVRVASDGPIYSGYSEVRSFTVTKAEVAPPVVVQQQPPPQITITPPDVIVNVPPTVEVPPQQVIAPAWIYTITVIGTLLFLAVIILIIRTRRAV
jgi:hypothetical protein